MEKEGGGIQTGVKHTREIYYRVVQCVPMICGVYAKECSFEHSAAEYEGWLIIEKPQLSNMLGYQVQH